MTREERYALQAQGKPVCTTCGAAADYPCLTPGGKVTQIHASRVRHARMKEQEANRKIEDDRPDRNVATCTAQMHSIANDNVWHHDCILLAGHEAPYHECSHHNRSRKQGCLWTTGAFIKDEEGP